MITDPPRGGMHVDVVKQLLKLAPKKMEIIVLGGENINIQIETPLNK